MGEAWTCFHLETSGCFQWQVPSREPDGGLALKKDHFPLLCKQTKISFQFWSTCTFGDRER